MYAMRRGLRSHVFGLRLAPGAVLGLVLSAGPGIGQPVKSVTKVGPGQAQAADAMVDVAVKDTEGSGVFSAVTKVTNIYTKGTAIAVTLKNGTAHIKCEPSDVIRAEPFGTVYRWSDPAPCTSPAALVVSFKTEAANFMLAAKYYEDTGDAGNAALVYNDLTAQFHLAAPEKAAKYTHLTFRYAAKALHVDEPTVKDDKGNDVPSPELEQAVRDFQANSKLNQNGKLNFPTLLMLANKDKGDSSHQSLEEIIAAAPKTDKQDKQ
jgi:hypothetical protein